MLQCETLCHWESRFKRDQYISCNLVWTFVSHFVFRDGVASTRLHDATRQLKYSSVADFHLDLYHLSPWLPYSSFIHTAIHSFFTSCAPCIITNHCSYSCAILPFEILSINEDTVCVAHWQVSQALTRNSAAGHFIPLFCNFCQHWNTWRTTVYSDSYPKHGAPVLAEPGHSAQRSIIRSITSVPEVVCLSDYPLQSFPFAIKP